MSVIADVRLEREDLARVLKRHKGIRKVVEDLYPDRAHFIYELLQNAEDAEATEARFILSKTALIFEHNGRSFEPKDIYAITDIGEGTKAEDEDKIGRFGVGFKAVFAYSETPHIWSPKYSFMISELVLPSELNSKPELGRWTRFEFPFNNPKKKIEDAYTEVQQGLDELADTTLLFLSHLGSIGWQSGQELSGEVRRIQHSATHYEVLKQVNGKISTSAHYLKYDRPVKGHEKQRVAVAYKMDFLPNVDDFNAEEPLVTQFRIVPVIPGQVSVFFPAEKETSCLRFHLHAPFVTELSRASLKRTPANYPLFDQLSELAVASLHSIRDLNLLTGEFLGVLPNQGDPIPEQYVCIRSAIIAEMNEKPLTPTLTKSHAPAKHLLQAPSSLKELLEVGDIKFLLNEDKQWAISAALRNSDADRFLTGLAITKWEINKFVTLLTEKATEGVHYASNPPHVVYGPDEEFMRWLAAKSLEWHQELYSLLHRELEAESNWYSLKRLQIVRLSDGAYSVGSKCFFPSEGIDRDDLLPRVDSGVFLSGKSKTQQANARKLLEALGVREVGILEEVEAILEHRYTKESPIPDANNHHNDLKQFVALVEKHPEKAERFTKYFIFERKDGKWATPDGVYLDCPYRDTGLHAYYEPLGEEAKRVALADRYVSCGISTPRLAKFAEAVGVHIQLRVERTSCKSNPRWSYLETAPGYWTTEYERDEDYVIFGLDKLLMKPSLNISTLVWQAMSALPDSPNVLVARYRRNKKGATRIADSQLVCQLRETAWVPQGEDQFVRPANASVELLPESFRCDVDWDSPWLEAIAFGQELVKTSVERAQQLAAAQTLGFRDKAALEDAQWFSNLPPEQRESLRIEYQRRKTTELPGDESSDPERRAKLVAEQASRAPERLTEERTRSVPIGLEDIKQKAKQYLRTQYTNSDGEMICQICKTTLPFQLDDGSYYYEAEEFLKDLNKRHYQNYLALCPNHEAMFKHANGSGKLLRGLFMNLECDQLEVVLARKHSTIYFTKKHIADLKTVIEEDQRV